MEDPIKLWQHIHGATVHFPIAGLFLALAFDLGGTLFRRPNWKLVGFFVLFAVAVVSIPAVISGLTGYNGWFGVEKYGGTAETMERHRNLALIGSWTATGLFLWRLFRKDNLSKVEWIVYLVFLTVATAAMGVTGWLGGYVARGY